METTKPPQIQTYDGAHKADLQKGVPEKEDKAESSKESSKAQMEKGNLGEHVAEIVPQISDLLGTSNDGTMIERASDAELLARDLKSCKMDNGPTKDELRAQRSSMKSYFYSVPVDDKPGKLLYGWATKPIGNPPANGLEDFFFGFVPGFQNSVQYMSQIPLIHRIMTELLPIEQAKETSKVYREWTRWRQKVLENHSNEDPTVQQFRAECLFWNKSWPGIFKHFQFRGADPRNGEPFLRDGNTSTKPTCDNCGEEGHAFWVCVVPCYGCQSTEHKFPHCMDEKGLEVLTTVTYRVR